MGTDVAALWQEAAKLLQEHCSNQTGSASAQAGLQRAYNLTGQLRQLPTPAEAVWTVLEVQQVCCARICASQPHDQLPQGVRDSLGTGRLACRDSTCITHITMCSTQLV